jgi:hypothetical protein
MNEQKSPYCLNIYSFMYVSGHAKDGAFLQRIDPQKRILIYIRMALRLARGVYAKFGVPLTLITNNELALTHAIATIGDNNWERYLALVQREFASNQIPDDAGFFSSTHRILLFDFFARQTGYSVLLDLDMICLNGENEPLSKFMHEGAPLVYDISDQVFPVYSYCRIYEDMEKFGSTDRGFRWYGGEFIAGGPDFFRELSDLSMVALPRYQDVYKTLHHQGFEMVLSYSLNQMCQRKSRNIPTDIGIIDIVRRHYGQVVRHDERRLGHTSNITFLHLLSVKRLLASSLSDQAIVRLLIGTELLPRSLAGPFLSALGTIL